MVLTCPSCPGVCLYFACDKPYDSHVIDTVRLGNEAGSPGNVSSVYQKKKKKKKSPCACLSMCDATATGRQGEIENEGLGFRATGNRLRSEMQHSTKRRKPHCVLTGTKRGQGRQGFSQGSRVGPLLHHPFFFDVFPRWIA